ncbi:DUF6289 family protein [Luteimonas saliphila]|uniref:DUF6289 family protein n=1 Tax=Luteimonas saliphila TaxID=2804919 RepID=UPI001EE2D15A|nr:DUF6289 family protein [Luteimonas saliphila]
MRISTRSVRLAVLATFLTLSLGVGAATETGGEANCCYPGSVIYYDEAGAVVGVRMYGCGDPGWGVVTPRARAVDGCIM